MRTLALWDAAGGSTACQLTAGATNFSVDLEEAAGGGGLASPHDILDAALAACTTLTLQLYAKRKGMPLTQVQVSVTHTEQSGVYSMARQILVVGDVTDEQRSSLLRVAEACPVHKTLRGTFSIVSELQATTI